MSSDRNLDPLDCLKVYGLRFHIEVAFRVLKHIMGGFCYRFWSKLWPSSGKNTLPILLWTKNNPIAMKALEVLRAIERFVNLAIVAQGILSYFALIKKKRVWQLHHLHSWLRSYSSPIPSEEVVQRILQAHFFSGFSVSLYAWIKDHSHTHISNENQRSSHSTIKDKVPKSGTLAPFLLS